MDALAIHVISVLFAPCRNQARATEDRHTAVAQENTVQSTNRLIVEWEKLRGRELCSTHCDRNQANAKEQNGRPTIRNEIARCKPEGKRATG